MNVIIQTITLFNIKTLFSLPYLHLPCRTGRLRRPRRVQPLRGLHGGRGGERGLRLRSGGLPRPLHRHSSALEVDPGNGLLGLSVILYSFASSFSWTFFFSFYLFNCYFTYCDSRRWCIRETNNSCVVIL